MERYQPLHILKELQGYCPVILTSHSSYPNPAHNIEIATTISGCLDTMGKKNYTFVHVFLLCRLSISCRILPRCLTAQTNTTNLPYFSFFASASFDPASSVCRCWYDGSSEIASTDATGTNADYGHTYCYTNVINKHLQLASCIWGSGRRSTMLALLK